MKALTVQQPWAWAIVHGGKDVENRTAMWSHRGPLAIHAGNRWSERGAIAEPIIEAAIKAAPDDEWIVSRYGVDPRFEAYVRGAIIGVVDLVGAHVAVPGCCESPWAESSYAEHGGRTRRDVVHLELDHPRPLVTPVPAKGRLGLWDLNPEQLHAVTDQGWAA